MYLLGTKMDYIEDELKSEFVFINPNSKVKYYIICNLTYKGSMWLW